MTEQAYLSLGSNIDPERNLPRAIRGLRALGRVAAISTVYRSPAVGPTPQSDYLNAAVLLETDLPPGTLRLELRRLEARLGRQRSHDKYAPRSIDIDLVLLGTAIVHDPPLTLPHPDLLRQPHVAIPVAELGPDRPHPSTGERLADIADRLRPQAALVPQPEVGRAMRRAAGLSCGRSEA